MIELRDSHGYNIIGKQSISNLDYYFQDLHVCTQRDDKVLAYNGTDTLSLSINGGSTFPITLDVTGVISIVTFAHIFSNGNILFANHAKIYLSTDNLSTYNEITPLDIDGDPFVASTYNNFKPLIYDFATVDGSEVLVWGNYSTDDGTKYVNINAWYSADNGATIKSFWKANDSAPVHPARHIHAINQNSYDESFWIQTGDGTDECNVLRAVYTPGTDTWAITKLAGDNEGGSGAASNNTYYKIVGMVFYNNYVYWASDSQDSTRFGVYRSPWDEFTDKATYQKMIDADAEAVGIKGDGTGKMIFFINELQWCGYTKDGEIFVLEPINGGPTLNPAFGAYLQIQPPNADGYFRCDPFTASEVFRDFTANEVLLIKII